MGLTTCHACTACQHGKSAVAYAAKYAHSAVLKALLVAGASHEIRDVTGMAPIHWAALHRTRADCLKLLLHAGAARDTRTYTGRCALYYAASKGYLEACTLLIAAKADVTIPNVVRAARARALLLQALMSCRSGRPGAVPQCRSTWLFQLLWRAQAPRCAAAQIGKTPLHAAAAKGHDACAAIILAAGCDINATTTVRPALSTSQLRAVP